MPLSDYERHVLAQLELNFSSDSGHLNRVERRYRRRRALAAAMVPLGQLVGLVLVLVGVRFDDRVGPVLAMAGYLLLVASGRAGYLRVRTVAAAARRAQRAQTG